MVVFEYDIHVLQELQTLIQNTELHSSQCLLKSELFLS